MLLPVFYAPPENSDGVTVTLPDEESHHALRVMRLWPGSRVIVIDGLGTAFEGLIGDLVAQGSPVQVTVKNTIRNFGEPAAHLTLAAGLSVGSKFDTVVEKGTELGVKRFVPLLTEKSKVHIEDADRAAARVGRLEKVALAAAKQCRRSFRPEISAPVNLDAFLGRTDRHAMNLIFHAGPGALSLDRLSLRPNMPQVTLLVGPESGFSDEEVTRTLSAGFTPVSLGPRILRTETAGPVVCALVMNALGELS